jgi:putative FmdB family regulatory protein
MPIYEYWCSVCEAAHEAIVLPGETEPVSCPACGGNLNRRIPSSVGINFTGPGFFATDNRKKPARSAKEDVPKPTKEVKKPEPPNPEP